ncbi:TRNA DIMETHYLALLYLTRANSFERASE [Salix purpurea]|uniref:tRNA DIMETHYLALLYLTRANSFERASE n=1 Tax=Salix purpurea TaxID=77065 RepID=A0A9Q0UAE1_SALPP|nr:TRNA DIMETHYLALLYLTRANSFERASE [Salix purpurea]
MKIPFSKSTIQPLCTAHKIQPFHPIDIYKPFNKPRPPPIAVRMDTDSSTTTSTAVYHHKKDKVVVIMGATGCGKTRVSIDLATCFQSEIVNSDKMQVYKGLDITTNKITIQDRQGVPHHLLGEVDPDAGELTPSEYRLSGGLAISGIVSRQKLPIVVGGSNSLIHALVADRFNPELNVFDGSNPVSTQLRYNCCFLWVDVSLPVLCDYLCKRVDEMLDSGMLDELSEYYGSVDPASQIGLRKAIGVPEFGRYLKEYPPGSGCGRGMVKIAPPHPSRLRIFSSLLVRVLNDGEFLGYISGVHKWGARMCSEQPVLQHQDFLGFGIVLGASFSFPPLKGFI